MKTTKFFKTLSLFMAMLVFVSSLGYSLDIHYCGGDIFDFSFVGDVTSCQEKEQTNTNQSKFTKKGCCDLDHMKVETSNEFQLSTYDLEQNSVKAITFSTLLSQLDLIEINKEVAYKTLDYPPIICTNKVYKEKECFLI